MNEEFENTAGEGAAEEQRENREQDPFFSDALFENRSFIGEKENADFQSFSIKKQMGVFQIVGPIAFALLGGLMIAMKDYVLGGILLALAVLYAFFPLLLKKVATSKKNVPDALSQGMEETVRAYADRLEISTVSGGIPMGSSALLYGQIREAVASGRYIFVYIAKMQAHLILADGFTKGNAPEFLAFLEGKGVKVKYKN